jgi:hypothetical protein
MHPIFLAKLRPQEVRESDGTVRYVVDPAAAKALGSYVNPPLETSPAEEAARTAVVTRQAPKQQQKSAPPANYAVASAESKPAPAPARQPESSGGGFSSLFSSTSDSRNEGVFGRMKNSVGRLFGQDDDKPSAPAAAAKPAAAPKAAPRPAAQAKQQPAQQAQPQQPVAAPEPAPVAQAQPRQSAASGASLMQGATPTVPTGSFSNRWGGIQ